MICVSIQHCSLEEILHLLESNNPPIQMAEIRLDRCELSLEDIETLFSSDTPLVATCRVTGDGAGTWQEAEEKLTAAIKAGAAFVDVEVEAPKEIGKRLRKACDEYGTTMIRSCHFFDGTPETEVLVETLEKCRRYGGEIAKIVAMASCKADSDRIMSLYNWVRRGELIAFAMGPEGHDSRLECLRFGSPFTYASLSENAATAPGQWSYSEMTSKVYGSMKPIGFGLRGNKAEPLNMPASKSFAQRAIIAAGLAEGISHISGYSPCGDTEAALKAARSLGATIERNESTLTITGINAKPECIGKTSRIFVGESGLLTRLMIPVCATVSGGKVEIDGEGTLLARPLKGAAAIMAPFGIVLKPILKDESAAKGEPKVPLTVEGRLLPGKVKISGKDGSQLISGLLTALPLLDSDSTVYVTEPKSIPYMFITLDVLKKFGIEIGSEMEGDEEFLETKDWSRCSGITFRIKGGQHYRAADFSIEGDWSAAANFLVAGSIFGKASLSGLDPHSLQADITIIDILTQAGARLSQTEDSENCIFTVQKAPLNAFHADLNNCPDLFPIVSILASFCTGQSCLEGFRRLAGKESDRGTAIMNTLLKMGVRSDVRGDALMIEGESLESRAINGQLLRGGKYSSYRDHRMAMAITVASLGADSEIILDDTDCVGKSFPAFFETWQKAL